MGEKYLFLTSGGLSEDMKKKFFGVVGKKPEEVKILYIPTAGIETDSAREGFAICLYELFLMGIPHENIFVYNLELLLSKEYERTYSAYIQDIPVTARLLTEEELKGFDAAFVSGGDGAVLCREMKRTGFDCALANAVNQGLVYVGISAGSMYAAGNFEDGLHMIENPLVPHGNKYVSEELPAGGEEIQIADGQAVYIERDSLSLIQ